MTYKVIGTTIEDGERRKIYYGEFDTYAEAYDYKEYLENPNHWTINDPRRPYMVYIEEIKTDGDKYFDDAMENEEQDEY